MSSSDVASDSLPVSPQERHTERTPAYELIDYLREQIAKVYAERSIVIDRLFALERQASDEGRSYDWEHIRNQRSRAIYDLERATEPMKRQIIAIAEAIEAANPQKLVFLLSDGALGRQGKPIDAVPGAVDDRRDGE